METKRIFYSWMDWRPTSTNHYLIGEALDEAAKLVKTRSKGRFILRVDQDTRDSPGARTIADVVLGKIDECDLFLGDVSLVETDATDKHGNRRKTTNPNVMLELGWAAQRRSWHEMILVFNDAYGDTPTEVPFDLGYKKVIAYSASETDPDLEKVRDSLAQRLATEILGILEEPLAFSNQWLQGLMLVLADVAAELDEMDKRADGYASGKSNTRSLAERTRRLAATQEAADRQGRDILHELAAGCDALHTALTRSGHRRKEAAAQLEDAARRAKSALVDPARVKASDRDAVIQRLDECANRADDLARRGPNMSPDDIRQEASAVGRDLLAHCCFPEGKLPVNPAHLRASGSRLHLMAYGHAFSDPSASTKLAREIESVVAELRSTLPS